MAFDESKPYDFATLKQDYEDKKYARCFPVLREVKPLLAQDPMQVALLARIALLAGNSRLERSLWRWGAYKYPDNVEMLCGLAGAYQSAKRRIDAKDLLDRAYQLAEDDQELGKVLRQQGVLFSQLRFFTSAERCIQRAKELLGPEEVLNEEGYFLLLQESIQQSADCFKKAISVDPRRENTYPMLASLKVLEQDWAGAAEWLSAGLEQSPQSPQILYYLATIQWLLGNNDVFEDSIAKIMELNPKADFIPALSWLQGINAYRNEDWVQVKEMVAKNNAPLGKGFAPNLSTWNIEVPWERASLPLNPQIQRHNHCVPCAVSMILDYYGITIDQCELGQGMMDAKGTPMHKMYNWLNAQGCGVVSFRANIEQVKIALGNGIPLLMSLRSVAGAHVTIIYGFDDALQAFFLQDPSSLFPLPLPYQQYDERFVNSYYEAVAFVPAGEKHRLSVLHAWDEPGLRLLAQAMDLYSTSDNTQAEESAATLVASQQEEIYYSQFLLDCRIQYVGETDFRQAVEQLWDAPQSREYFRLRVINALMGRGLLREASDRLKDLKDRELGWYGALLQARLALTYEGNLDKALNAARRVVRLFPESGDSLSIMGQVLINLGEFSLAEQYLNWALELQPGQDWLYAYSGENHRRQGQYAQAGECFKQALAMDASNCWTLEQLGLCYLDQLQYDQGEDCFRRANSFEPQRPWPYDYLARTNEMRGNFQGAIDWLKQGLTVTEEHPKLLGSLGRILIERERYGEALPYLEKSLDKQPDPMISSLIASCLLETGYEAEAVKTIEDALNQQVDSPYLHAQCAHILSRAGQEEKAIVHLEKAIVLDPTYQWPLDLLLGLCKRGDTEKGRQVIEGILNRLGPSVNLLCYLGSLWEMEGEMRRAEALYHQALKLEPDFDFPRFRLAEIQRLEERWTEAERSYTELLKSAAPPLGAYFSLAEVYRQTDRLAEAKTILSQVPGKIKDDPYYWSRLLSFMEDVGSIQEFESFLPQLPPGYLHSKLVHAHYLEAVGRENEAATMLESYLAAHPEDLQSLNEVARHFERHGHLQKAEDKWAQSFGRVGAEKALVGLLRTLYNQDKLVDAEILVNGPRLTPKQKRDAYIGLGVWFYEDSRYHEAVTWLNTDVVMDKAEDYIYTYLAFSLHRLGRGDEAIELISKAYSLFPDNVNVIYWYGDILSDRGEWQEAAQAYERLYLLYKDNKQKAYALAMQGYCLSKMGKGQDARSKFQQALDLDPLQEMAATNIASGYLRNGRYPDVITVLGPIIDAGRGLQMQNLVRYFLMAAFALGLPGKQRWLALAAQRLRDIQASGQAGANEEKLLAAQVKELAVELEDKKVQKEFGPKNFFAKALEKYKVWRRMIPWRKLVLIAIPCLFVIVGLAAIKDIYLYSDVQADSIAQFVWCLIFCVLLVFRVNWARENLINLVISFAIVFFILDALGIGNLPVDNTHVLVGISALQFIFLSIATFMLVTLKTKTISLK